MRIRQLVLLAGAGFFMACGGDDNGGDDETVYHLQVTAAPPTTATVGTAIPVSFTITRTVGSGTATPVSGRSVTFTVVAGGGTVGGSSSTTVTSGADGVIATTWTLGNTAGVQTLRGTSSGVDPVEVSVTATARAATQIALATQPSASAQTGVPFTRQPVIQLRDANGAAVAQAGVVVTATVATGSATLGGTTTATTDATGSATFTNLTLTGTGATTLRFTATLGGQSVNVTSDATAVIPPNQLALTTAPSASASGVPFFQQPVIQLQDGNGTAIRQAGVVVTASTTGITTALAVAAGGSGSLTATTDADGQAAFRDLTLTGSGAAALQFTATGFTPVSSAALNVGTSAATVLVNRSQNAVAAASAGNVSYYTFEVPATATSLEFVTSEGTGAIELLARRGVAPTARDFDCRAAVTATATSQRCAPTGTLSGTWYVAVRSASATTASTVEARYSTALCTTKTLTIGTPATGSLVAGTSCTAFTVSGNRADRYLLTVPTSQAVRFAASANSFLALQIKGPDATQYVYAGGITNFTSEVTLLAPGTYELLIRDNLQGGAATFNYTLSATAVTPPAPNGCELMTWESSGLNIGLTLTNADCAGTVTGTRSHRITVLISSGQTLTLTMASTAFDPLIRLLTGQVTGAGTVVASDDNGGGGTTARLVYTNPGAAAFFTLEMTSATAGATGAYTMTGSFALPIYNLRLSPAEPELIPAPGYRMTGLDARQP